METPIETLRQKLIASLHESKPVYYFAAPDHIGYRARLTELYPDSPYYPCVMAGYGYGDYPLFVASACLEHSMRQSSRLP